MNEVEAEIRFIEGLLEAEDREEYQVVYLEAKENGLTDERMNELASYLDELLRKVRTS